MQDFTQVLEEAFIMRVKDRKGPTLVTVSVSSRHSNAPRQTMQTSGAPTASIYSSLSCLLAPRGGVVIRSKLGSVGLG